MTSLMLCVVTTIALFSIGTLAEKASPTQCCWTAQWEGIIYEKLGVYNQATNFASVADIVDNIHVDYTRKMIVNNMSITNGTSSNVLTVIEDFNKHISYTIVGMYCVVSNLTATMSGNCVPETATYLTSSSIAGVLSDVWFISAGNVTVRVAVSQDGCIPVQEVLLSLGSASNLEIISVQNVTAGIANPSIFNVPTICNESAIYQEKPPFASILSTPLVFKHKSTRKVIT